MNNLIEKTITYVKEFFKNEFSGHDFWHTLRVYNVAKSIASTEECDSELVCLGALLHDVDDYKIVGKDAEPFKNAKTFLNTQGYPEDKIEKICHIISQVSFKGKDTITPDTIEGKIVQDADRLDAIGAIGIVRAFTYGGNRNMPIHDPDIIYDDSMTQQEYYKNAGTTINHFYEKLLKLKDLMNTESAKKIAMHRHEYMEMFLKEFYDEWEGRV
ncbi:MAG: HD domain-containing protein [Clostridia bacterium]|nr:HD domain-containing protein [Clostridia bacterium]